MTHSQIYHQRFKTTEQRFWEKVNKDGPIPSRNPELGQCWEWTGAIGKRDWHGAFNVGDGSDKWAHRISYRWNVGVIPDGLSVLHKCDNPKCVNPAHLFLGTQRQNIDDMMQKGRQIKGEDKWCAKLTDAKVREMRAIHAGGGMSIRAIAKRFGIDHGHAGRIIRRQKWRHVI